MLFVIEDCERNVVDQKAIEVGLSQMKIKSMRMTFSEIYKNHSMDPHSNVLTVRGKEIGFVYYRCGYQAEQYTSEDDWETRKVLELSQAIKCPSIDYHLTTFKKFQQSFCDPEVLKQVLTEKQRFKDLQEKLEPVFQGMWSLENFDEQPSV